MDKMPLVAVVCQSFPESVLLFTLGLTLMGIPLRWQRLIIAAAILSAVSYFVRSLPLPYGTHALLHLLAMCLLIMAFFRAPLQLAATAALLSAIALAILEFILWPLIFLLTGLSIQEIWARPVLRVLIPLPELVLLAAFTWWCRKKKITLATPWPFQQKARGKNKHGGSNNECRIIQLCVNYFSPFPVFHFMCGHSIHDHKQSDHLPGHNFGDHPDRDH